MKKIAVFCFLLIIVTCYNVKAQESSTVSINPADPAFRAKFSELSFNGKFSTMAVTDPVNNYYMADFSQLPVKFEKVYFLSLIFTCGKIVNIDSDLSQNRIWFLANKKYTVKEINILFDELKEKTLKQSSVMTDEQKAVWMKKNDKY
jgi:hypothetical protein